MKCIKSGDKVIRVDDEKARKLVESGKWKFSTKGAWKSGGRKRG
jgi:hypothetical protein